MGVYAYHGETSSVAIAPSSSCSSAAGGAAVVAIQKSAWITVESCHVVSPVVEHWCGSATAGQNVFFG
eukprot:COSAG05_NODE_11225_length_524_cov_0.835294_2_plen_68_part_00